jgi:Endonuclease NucS
MKEAAAEISYPARAGDLIAWFAERYPNVKSTTVRAHVKGLTENDSSRHHYATLARREPLFTRSRDGALMPFDTSAAGDAEDDEVELDAEVEDGELEFALEAYLEEFLLTNFDRIDWGRPLELWESDEGELGHQYVTDVGRLDFLCRDTADDTLVVIELKRGRPSDRVVGQAARYMGWVGANLARPGQRVRGLIVAHEQEDRLAYAVAAVPDLSVLTYQIDFRLSVPARPGAIAS